MCYKGELRIPSDTLFRKKRHSQVSYFYLPLNKAEETSNDDYPIYVCAKDQREVL